MTNTLRTVPIAIPNSKEICKFMKFNATSGIEILVNQASLESLENQTKIWKGLKDTLIN